MSAIRHHIAPWTILAILVISIGGGLYPVLHKIEHGRELSARTASTDAHDHSDHARAIENPQSSLSSETCLVCVRQAHAAPLSYGSVGVLQLDAPDSGLMPENRMDAGAPLSNSSRAPPVLA